MPAQRCQKFCLIKVKTSSFAQWMLPESSSTMHLIVVDGTQVTVHFNSQLR